MPTPQRNPRLTPRPSGTVCESLPHTSTAPEHAPVGKREAFCSEPPPGCRDESIAAGRPLGRPIATTDLKPNWTTAVFKKLLAFITGAILALGLMRPPPLLIDQKHCLPILTTSRCSVPEV
jgi:hypothetical protein